MGKFLVISLTDHEEYILSRIMEIIAVEPGFDHIVTSHPCNTLIFSGLELRLKERTAYRNGELISMTRREFATLVYLAKHPSWVFSAGQLYEEVWGRMVKIAERLLPSYRKSIRIRCITEGEACYMYVAIIIITYKARHKAI